MQYSLCNAWEFTETCTEAFLRGEPVETESVRLPHTCREVPLHYASPRDYEMVCGYQRKTHAQRNAVTLHGPCGCSQAFPSI